MKAREENSVITTYPTLPNVWKNYLNFDKADVATLEAEGFYDVVLPAFNTATEYLGSLFFNGVVFTANVVAKTQQEMIDERLEQAQVQDNATQIAELKQIVALLSKPLLTSVDTTEEELVLITQAYPVFREGVAYAIGDVFKYLNGKLYEVVQAHTSQLDWEPPTLPALYKVVVPPGIVPDWVQPTGAQDAYNTGDRVKHNGFTWESTTDANVWEPGVFGWVQI